MKIKWIILYIYIIYILLKLSGWIIMINFNPNIAHISSYHTHIWGSFPFQYPSISHPFQWRHPAAAPPPSFFGTCCASSPTPPPSVWSVRSPPRPAESAQHLPHRASPPWARSVGSSPKIKGCTVQMAINNRDLYECLRFIGVVGVYRGL